jgi:hypothetical protein
MRLSTASDLVCVIGNILIGRKQLCGLIHDNCGGVHQEVGIACH